MLSILIWTAVGIFQAVPEMILRGFIWYYFIEKLIAAWAWVLLTPAILLVDRWVSAGRQDFVRIAAIHLALSVPFSLIHILLSALLQYPIEAISWSPFRSPEYTIYYFLGAWVTYCAVVGILQSVKFNSGLLKSQFELERVEKRLLETRLNALRLQLEPHFLFNTLNSISSEVTENPKLARQMIEDLGVLLRRSIESQDSNEIALAQELALLDRYLAIQKLRFGKRIEFRTDVDPEVLSVMVPSMVLQPLVENAVRHGLESRVSGGTITISARRRDGRLLIGVVDDGVGLPPAWKMDSGAGLGIRVTRERLEALYGADCSFAVSRRRGGGAKVLIHIPIHNAGAGAGETCV